MILGVEYTEKKENRFYLIDSISDEFKLLLRSNLSEICYGINKLNIGISKFSLQNTARAFLDRFGVLDGEINDRQKGFLGELFVHILLKNDKNLEPLSLFFNLEEKSAKKGFDLVFQNKKSQKILLVEVKSGLKLDSHSNVTTTAKLLIQKAKRDLVSRLSNSNDRERLWDNAISHAQQAILDSRSEKEALLKLLGDNWNNLETKQEFIFAAGVFADFAEKINIEDICLLNDGFIADSSMNDYSDKCTVLVIHTNVYRDLYNFLIEVKTNG